MGFLAPAIPVLKWIGTALGTVLAVKEVDDVIGSPVQRKLGWVDEPEAFDYDAVEMDRAARAEAKSKQEGLANYLYSLETLAPGYVDRNRSQLKLSYNKVIEARTQKEKSL
jgi:hypothetical protein